MPSISWVSITIVRGEHDTAEQWWCTAARAGHLDAQYNVGTYHYQRGDLETAKYWYRVAAEAGQPEASRTLKLLMRRQGDATSPGHAKHPKRAVGGSDHADSHCQVMDLRSRHGDKSIRKADGTQEIK
jgi:TPR repeat protein